MSIATKLKTVYDGCSDIRAAIKEKDSTRGSGAIGTLADDITALNPKNVIVKVYKDGNGNYSLDLDANNTDNIAASKYINNTNIIAVALPESIKTLNPECFKSTTNLKYINLNAVNSISNAAFEKSGTIDISSFKGSTIGTYAFWKSSITGILTDPNLSSIGVYAFAETNITEIQDLGTITSISDVGFSNCKSLTFVRIPSTVTRIGNSAFERCSKLETVVVLAVSPPTFSNAYVFNLCPALTTIYVPYSSDHSILDAYKAATNWSAYASKIYELNEDGTVPTT